MGRRLFFVVILTTTLLGTLAFRSSADSYADQNHLAVESFLENVLKAQDDLEWVNQAARLTKERIDLAGMPHWDESGNLNLDNQFNIRSCQPCNRFDIPDLHSSLHAGESEYPHDMYADENTLHANSLYNTKTSKSNEFYRGASEHGEPSMSDARPNDISSKREVAQGQDLDLHCANVDSGIKHLVSENQLHKVNNDPHLVALPDIERERKTCECLKEERLDSTQSIPGDDAHGGVNRRDTRRNYVEPCGAVRRSCHGGSRFQVSRAQKQEQERQRLQLEDADGLLKGVRDSSKIGSTDNQMEMNKLNQPKPQPIIISYRQTGSGKQHLNPKPPHSVTLGVVKSAYHSGDANHGEQDLGEYSSLQHNDDSSSLSCNNLREEQKLTREDFEILYSKALNENDELLFNPSEQFRDFDASSADSLLEKYREKRKALMRVSNLLPVSEESDQDGCEGEEEFNPTVDQVNEKVDTIFVRDNAIAQLSEAGRNYSKKSSSVLQSKKVKDGSKMAENTGSSTSNGITDFSIGKNLPIMSNLLNDAARLNASYIFPSKFDTPSEIIACRKSTKDLSKKMDSHLPRKLHENKPKPIEESKSLEEVKTDHNSKTVHIVILPTRRDDISMVQSSKSKDKRYLNMDMNDFVFEPSAVASENAEQAEIIEFRNWLANKYPHQDSDVNQFTYKIADVDRCKSKGGATENHSQLSRNPHIFDNIMAPATTAEGMGKYLELPPEESHNSITREYGKCVKNGRRTLLSVPRAFDSDEGAILSRNIPIIDSALQMAHLDSDPVDHYDSQQNSKSSRPEANMYSESSGDKTNEDARSRSILCDDDDDSLQAIIDSRSNLPILKRVKRLTFSSPRHTEEDGMVVNSYSNPEFDVISFKDNAVKLQETPYEVISDIAHSEVTDNDNQLSPASTNVFTKRDIVFETGRDSCLKCSFREEDEDENEYKTSDQHEFVESLCPKLSEAIPKDNQDCEKRQHIHHRRELERGIEMCKRLHKKHNINLSGNYGRSKSIRRRNTPLDCPNCKLSGLTTDLKSYSNTIRKRQSYTDRKLPVERSTAGKYSDNNYGIERNMLKENVNLRAIVDNSNRPAFPLDNEMDINKMSFSHTQPWDSMVSTDVGNYRMPGLTGDIFNTANSPAYFSSSQGKLKDSPSAWEHGSNPSWPGGVDTYLSGQRPSNGGIDLTRSVTSCACRTTTTTELPPFRTPHSTPFPSPSINDFERLKPPSKVHLRTFSTKNTRYLPGSHMRIAASSNPHNTGSRYRGESGFMRLSSPRRRANGDSKRGDLDNSQLAMDLVTTVYKQVDKSPTLKKVLGPGLKRRFPATPVLDGEGRNGCKCLRMLHQIKQIMGCSGRGKEKLEECTSLPSDLKKFMKWLLKNTPRSETSRNLMNRLKSPRKNVCPRKRTMVERESAYWPLQPSDIKTKRETLKKLIGQFDDLQEKEQVQLKPIHDYLVKQVDFLTSTLDGTSSLIPSWTGPLDGNVHPQTLEDIQKNELIEKNLQSLGLGSSVLGADDMNGNNLFVPNLSIKNRRAAFSNRVNDYKFIPYDRRTQSLQHFRNSPDSYKIQSSGDIENCLNGQKWHQTVNNRFGDQNRLRCNRPSLKYKRLVARGTEIRRKRHLIKRS